MTKTQNRKPTHRPRLAAFTLIELLVVVSIIALLLSLLLPSLSSAKRIGQRAACMAKLRDIAKGMIEYGQDNEDAILGGPYTSGAYLRDAAKAWGPAVQTWDFMGPLTQLWNSPLTTASAGDPDAVVCKRFDEIRSHPAFLCSGNSFLAASYTTSMDAGAGWMISYNTHRLQLRPASSWIGDTAKGHTPPNDWKPITQRMGVSSDKIYCGDGARYSKCTEVPDYDLVHDATDMTGGAFADTGCYSGYSRSWDRCRAPGNSGAPGGHATTMVDPRIYAYRHSTAEPPVGAMGNAYKGNFAFYDGHADTLGDLDSSNPYLWLPKGAKLTGTAGEMWPDTINFFGLGTDAQI